MTRDDIEPAIADCRDELVLFTLTNASAVYERSGFDEHGNLRLLKRSALIDGKRS